MRLSDDQRALAADPWHLRTAERLAARPMARHPRRAEEILSAARLGLVLAAARFEPGRGYEFNTFLFHYIKGHIAHALRARRGVPRVVSLAGRPPGAGEGATYADTIPAPGEPVGWELDYHDWVEGLARRLPPRAAESFLRVHTRASDRPQADAGRAMGITQAAVSSRLAAATAALRGEVEC